MALSVRVKCFNGDVYDLKCDETELVQSFQDKIAAASGIAANRQTLLFKGQVLEGEKPLSDFNVTDGVIVNVVRKVGKSTPATNSTPAAAAPAAAAATAPAAAAPAAAAPAAAAAARAAPTEPQMPTMPSGMPGMPGLGGSAVDQAKYEEFVRSMQGALGQLGGGAGGMQGLNSLLQGGGAGGAAGGAGGMNMMEIMKQASNMDGAQMNELMQWMSQMLNSKEIQEYLDSPERLEQERLVMKNHPLMKSVMEARPDLAQAVDDPEKWKAYTEEARKYITQLTTGDMDGAAAAAAAVPGAAVGGGGAAEGSDADKATARGAPSGPAMPPTGMGISPAALAKSAEARKSAAEMIPPGLDLVKLAEAYGHALGQSLVNSAMGLDPNEVIKGLRNACDSQPFPMPLPDYERQMRTLQGVAAQYLSEANLQDAEWFFEETQKEENIHVLRPNRIIWESSDTPPDPDAPEATATDEVLVILEGRLHDGRVFFTCPAADDKGETVHPLSLPLETAPMALAEGIVGMKENESRTLYVHPANCEGMTDMFGDLLPPNAMLAFDIELVSCNAGKEEKQDD